MVGRKFAKRLRGSRSSCSATTLRRKKGASHTHRRMQMAMQAKGMSKMARQACEWRAGLVQKAEGGGGRGGEKAEEEEEEEPRTGFLIRPAEPCKGGASTSPLQVAPDTPSGT